MSSVLPTPPHSTLLPYTTLFRSRFRSAAYSGAHSRADGARQDDGGRSQPQPRMGWRLRRALGRLSLLSFSVFVLVETQHIGDRKSTRLNSSHLGISYAVFCLNIK